MRSYKINTVNDSLREALQHKINHKTKPVGSLGRLEEIALQIGLIQNTDSPMLSKPHIVVFAGDHGVACEGMSAYPQEVTWQMVMNFLHGGAAINAFCKQHDIELKVVDAGVNYDFPKDANNGLIHNKTAKGTANFTKESAMSITQAENSMDTSATIVREIAASGCNVIGFGEMGIANTSSAALLMSVLTAIPIQHCAGRGTGLTDEALQLKIDRLKMVLIKHGKPNTPLEVLATYGGFEIAQIVGAILQAAENKMVVLIDGFIASAAYLVAQAIEPNVKAYCLFCHQSHEQGHKLLLEYIHVKPILNLDMRLGEGTGVAVAYPIIQSALTFLNEMASFEAAGVSNKNR
jgi:nicotinate-nucleotide--dimethylbenzimidazole phosphoribosyltransferase